MDTTRFIKLFVILQILLAVTGFVMFPMQSHLPPSLQEYLSHDMESETDIVDLLAFYALLIYMISVVGLLLTKMWARNLYAFSMLLNYASISLMGPTVEHAFFTTLAHLDSLTDGAILALLYFTSSAFNKTHQQELSVKKNDMHSSKEEIKQNQRKLFTLIIIDSLAVMFVGLGLYAVFGANGNAFLDILNNKSVAYGLITVGGVVTAWCHLKMALRRRALKILPLSKRQVKLANKQNR